MDNVTKLNPEYISELKVYYKREVNDPKYKSASLWNKAGFYDAWDTFYTVETIFKMDPNVYIENNAIYYKPNVMFIMTSGERYFKYFENREELDQFLFKVNHINWIII